MYRTKNHFLAEYYNEFISSLKDKVKEDKRIVSIINETIKEYVIKNPNSTIHLSGNSGFSSRYFGRMDCFVHR